MAIQEELKEKIFCAIEGRMSLRDFELWLYANEALLDQMNEDIVLDAYSFDYNQKGAWYGFKWTFSAYFDKEEFMLRKIKSNLKDLADGNETTNRILNEFYWMRYDELPFLQNLRYYIYALEDEEYMPMAKESITQELKREANALLQEILREEKQNPEFRISTFKREPLVEFTSESTNASNQKEWWQFWK
jgi:hypothetical protein